MIEELGFAGYFLVVWDIVEFCRRSGIYCQGRGSAASSAVCYVLGITNADAVALGLLFERFLSPERDGPPDIDVDIESGRREEVIQYVYGRYGRERAALVAVVVSYRARSAVRDAAKALGHSPGQVDAWAKRIERWGSLGGAHHPSAPHRKDRWTWWSAAAEGEAARRAAVEGRRSVHGSPRSRRRRCRARPRGGRERARDPGPGAGGGDRARGLSPPPRHPSRRHGDLRPPGLGGLPGRVGSHGEPDRAPVGQGRLRGGRPREVRPPRPRDARGDPPGGRHRRRLPPRRDRPGDDPPGGRRLRHAVPRRLGRGLPGGEPGADGDAAPVAAALLLRPRRRGRPHPPRPDPGRIGSSLPAPAQRDRAGDVPASRASSAAWRRPSGCRCSRSSSCRWRSTPPGSRRPRPISSARPWAQNAPPRAWNASAPASTRGWPSGGSPARSRTPSGSSWRPSPTSASPRATRCPSPTSST